MPTQLTTIDQEILYIINNWIQNSTQKITGTIGQNVVWNLAMFIKQVPENFQGAKIITSTTINYTASIDDCVIVFTNNSTGSLDWVDTRWNKFVIVNATDNIRTLANAKYYINLAGAIVTTFPARTSVTIVKGLDSIWYQTNTSGATVGVAGELIGIAGRGRAYDPIVGSSTYQHTALINKGGTDGFYEVFLNTVRMQNYGNNANFFATTPSIGLIDISPLIFNLNDSISYSI